MGKDKGKPGSLGARLLNFGRSRIQRYTADGDTPEPTAHSETPPASPVTPNVARTLAPRPAPEPSEDWEITHFDNEDTAALYDGDTVRYAQPKTPPSAVPRRTPPESRPVQRKPAAQNRDPGGKSRRPSPPEAPNPKTPPVTPTTPSHQTRAQINRMPEPPAENPPPPHRVASAPQQHDLPLIEDVEGYEAPLMSDSFELNAGFDLTPQPGIPAAPVQRDEIPPAPTPSAPTSPALSRSPVEHTFSEALPVALPPTRRERGFIEEFSTQQPEVHHDQPDYDLPYFDEETDRITEQIDGDSDDNDYGYHEQAAPDIPLMRYNAPPESHDTPIYRAPDPVSKAAVMPSFEGVYDESGYDTDEDADTIYNYDDDDDDEPEMLPDEESGEEMPFGSVEASLHDLMRYADDESDDESGDESSDYHTAVSFENEDSDLYDVAFDPDADDDSGANHDDPPSERTPGHMIRRFADAEADLLRLLDLPPGTPISLANALAAPASLPPQTYIAREMDDEDGTAESNSTIP